MCSSLSVGEILSYVAVVVFSNVYVGLAIHKNIVHGSSPMYPSRLTQRVEVHGYFGNRGDD